MVVKIFFAWVLFVKKNGFQITVPKKKAFQESAIYHEDH